MELVAEIEQDSSETHLPTSPDADYGLGDGFDPLKYDFYNPPQSFTRNSRPLHSNYKDPDLTKIKTDAALPKSNLEESTSKFSYLSPIQEQEDDSYSASKTKSIPFASHVDPTRLKETMIVRPKETIPPLDNAGQISVETLDDFLFSIHHLKDVLEDREMSVKLKMFLQRHQPSAINHVARFSNLKKALRSLRYAEAIVNDLESSKNATVASKVGMFAMPWVIQEEIDATLNLFVGDEFRAFVADIYARMSGEALADRVIGGYSSKGVDVVPGLAEVFVLSDPTRPDNPIVFTSDDFQRMTGYERAEFIGQNCRILGGPQTSRTGIKRFKEALVHEREICEVLVNYRRDGSAFMNLITCVPLRDHLGRLRYYIGAQVDITSLVLRCAGFPALREIQQNKGLENVSYGHARQNKSRNAFEGLCEYFNTQEIDHVAGLKKRQSKGTNTTGGIQNVTRGPENTPVDILASELSAFAQLKGIKSSSSSLGFYQTYLLMRPHPSLRILFTSPELQAPGIAQKPLLSLIGGSAKVCDHLAHALETGRKVTAKAQWLPTVESRPVLSWIHCTPLLGANDVVGAWMVIIVKAEEENGKDRTSPCSASAPAHQHRLLYDTAAVPWDARGTSEYSSARETVSRGSTETVVKSEAHRKSMLQNTIENGAEKTGTDLYHPELNNNGMSSESQPSLDGHTNTPNMPPGQSKPKDNGSKQTEPKVKIAGLRFIDDSGSKKPLIKLPGSRPITEGDQDEIPTRLTYKSLSPYGVLFQN